MFTPALVDRAFTVIYDVGIRIGFLKKLVILFGQAGVFYIKTLFVKFRRCDTSLIGL